MSKAKERIISDLVTKIQNSNEDWVKTWVPLYPENIRGTGYSGLNFVNLLFSGGASNKWLTFNQAVQAGYKVKKGAKGQYIIYASKKENKEGEEYYFLKGYFVFNLADMENYTPEEQIFSLSEIKAFTDKFQHLYMQENLADCYYSPFHHKINVPPVTQFKSEQDYFQVLFHELAHSTKVAIPRKYDYATEELVAELCAFFLCVKFGIAEEVKSNTVAYLKNWLKKNPPALLYDIAKDASKAFDYLVNAEALPV